MKTLFKRIVCGLQGHGGVNFHVERGKVHWRCKKCGSEWTERW